MSQQPALTGHPHQPPISSEEEEPLRRTHIVDALPGQSSPGGLPNPRAIDQDPVQNEEAEALRRVVRFLLEYYRSKSPDTKQPTREGHRESCPESD